MQFDAYYQSLNINIYCKYLGTNSLQHRNLSLNICDKYLYSRFDNMRQIAFSQIQDLSYEITFPCGAKNYNGKDART